MVEQGNAERIGGVFKPAGDFPVFGARIESRRDQKNVVMRADRSPE